MKRSINYLKNASTSPGKRNRLHLLALATLVLSVILSFAPQSASAFDLYLQTGSTVNGSGGSWSNGSSNEGSPKIDAQKFTDKGNNTFTLDITSWSNLTNNTLYFRFCRSDYGDGYAPYVDGTQKTIDPVSYSNDYGIYGTGDKFSWAFRPTAGYVYRITVKITNTDGQSSDHRTSLGSVKVEELALPIVSYEYQPNNGSWTSFTEGNNFVVLRGSQLPAKLRQNTYNVIEGTVSHSYKYFASDNASLTSIESNYTLVDDESSASQYTFDNKKNTRNYTLKYVEPSAEGTGKISLTEDDNNVKIYIKADAAPYIWAYTSTTNSLNTNQKWPGDQVTAETTVDGESGWYVWTSPSDETVFSYILSNGKGNGLNQSAELKADGKDVYVVYNGFNQTTIVDPNAASEITSGLQFNSNYNTTNWNTADMASKSNGWVWEYSDAVANFPAGDVYFRITNSTDVTKGLAAPSNALQVSVNDEVGAEASLGTPDENNGNYKFSNSEYARNRYSKFTFQAYRTVNGKWHVRILGTPKAHYEISYNRGDSWSWLAPDNGTSTTTSGTAYSSNFIIRHVAEDGTLSYLTVPSGSGSEISTTGLAFTSTVSSDVNSKSVGAVFTLPSSMTGSGNRSDGYGYTISINPSSNALTVAYAHENAGRWLWIKKNGANDETAVGYRMSPSRSRGGGAVSTTMFTQNIKSDELLKALQEKNGNSYISYGDAIEAYVTTGNKFSDTKASSYLSVGTKLQDKHSYTWYWDENTSNGAESSRWRVVDNAGGNISNDAGFGYNTDYYVIGNFESANADVQIDPSKDVNRTKLTRYVYKKGSNGVGTECPVGSDNIKDADLQAADSIVYRVNIPRPKEGWGELYLAVSPKEFMDDGNGSNPWNNDDWNLVIRPQVQTYNTDGDDGGYGGMDATATEGGLFKSTGAMTKTGWPVLDDRSRNQALNPDVSMHTTATSYIFSMNVTYHTYRIVFNDVAKDNHMYIVGPAVDVVNTTGATAFDDNGNVDKNGTIVNGTGSGTDDANTENSAKNWMGTGLQLTWDANEQCYKYMVDGKETAIRMIPKQQFRFVVGRDFTNPWYGEDSNKPLVIKSLTSDYGLTNNYSSSANNDTQFQNYLNTVPSSPTNKIYDVDQNITWGLENRPSTYEYNFIRLYIKRVGSESLAFYTVRRKVGFHKFSQSYSLQDETGQSYQYWRSWSDYNACRIPEGVHVYVVSDYDNTLETDMFTPQIGIAKLVDITSLGYIPANTGVILGCDENKFADNQHRVYMETYPDDPNATALPDGVNTKLTPAMGTDRVLNYDDTMFPFGEINGIAGFYYPKKGIKTTNNDCYLKYNPQQAKKNVVGSLAFTFGDIISVPTGIDSVEDSSDAETNAEAKAPYYTISGVRLSGKPSAPGFYIHNGKKIIIK